MNDSPNSLALDLERIEDNYDALAARLAAYESVGHEAFPFATVERICDGENSLSVWRQYRSLSLAELANKSGVPVGTLHAIESGEMTDPPFSTTLALSKALTIDIELVMARPPAD